MLAAVAVRNKRKKAETAPPFTVPKVPHPKLSFHWPIKKEGFSKNSPLHPPFINHRLHAKEEGGKNTNTARPWV